MDTRRHRFEPKPSGRIAPKDAGGAPEPGHPTVYQIRVRGHLDDRWAEGYEEMTVTREETGDTLLTVPVVDQAALLRLLRKLRDLGVSLVSINPAGPDLAGNASKEETR